MNTIKTTNGFTLLEVVIAVAIIATGFMGVYSLHLETISANNDIRFHIKAPLLAKEKIAELDADKEKIEDSSGDFGDDNAGYSWRVVSEEVESELLGASAEKFKKINLEIILNQGENSYSVMVYRFVHDSES